MEQVLTIPLIFPKKDRNTALLEGRTCKIILVQEPQYYSKRLQCCLSDTTSGWDSVETNGYNTAPFISIVIACARISSMELIRLQPSHASEAARLHIAGQPGTFLTALGSEFLTLLYRRLPQAKGSFGFTIIAQNEITLNDVDPRATSPTGINNLGFIAATTSIGHLLFDLGVHHPFALFSTLGKRYIKQPTLFGQTLQTLYYPLMDYSQSKSERENEMGAEILSIMVEPAYRSRGIGQHLLNRLVEHCRQHKFTILDVTVDATNAGARQFYQRHGFVEQKEFILYGRPMLRYQKALR